MSASQAWGSMPDSLAVSMSEARMAQLSASFGLMRDSLAGPTGAAEDPPLASTTLGPIADHIARRLRSAEILTTTHAPDGTRSACWCGVAWHPTGGPRFTGDMVPATVICGLSRECGKAQQRQGQNSH